MPITRLDRIVSPAYASVKGKEAWRRNLQSVTYACDKIRPSLGPKGSFKMVTYSRGPERVVKITKDAVSVLEEFAIQNPLLTIVSEAAKMQREEVGDGVASFIILLSGLLKKADELAALGIHRNTVIKGYLESTKKALEVIDAQAVKLDNDGLIGVLQAVDCGRNLLTTEMRKLIVEARGFVKEGKLDKNKIRIFKKTGGAISESRLIRGFIITKEKAHPNMPDRLENAKIVIITGETGTKRLEVKMPGEGRFPIKLDLKDPLNVARCKQVEKELRAKFVERIESVGANAVCCQQPLDNEIKGTLARHGVFALETVAKEDLEALSEASGARLTSMASGLLEQDIGHAESLEVEKIGLQKAVVFNGCDGVTFLLRGTTSQALDELEKTIRSCIIYLNIATRDMRTVPGAGATEMRVANKLNSLAKEFPGREQLAIKGFADALIDIPRCLAENSGLNSTDAISELKRQHALGNFSYSVTDLQGSGSACFELARTKISVIRRAYEVASLMLRIDEQIVSKEIPKFHKQ